MKKITIYHNARCQKSRYALDLINEKAGEVEVIEYLKTPPTEKELKSILKKLGMKAEAITRKKEPLFKEKFSSKTLSESEWIKVLAENPILIERPIVVKGDKAVIARLIENITAII